MADSLPFKHGEEGTHYACQEMVDKYGDKVGCCGCNGHNCKKELDPQTEQFIAFAKTALNNRSIVTALRFFIESRVIDFADRLVSDPKLIEACGLKMLKGAAQHGEPLHDEEFFNNALEEELMDMFLWELMRRWNKTL